MRRFDASKKVLIPFSHITHISKKVTEQISPKYLPSFLKTLILQKNILIPKNTKIFYSFIKEANIYEIYLFETTNKNPILEFQLFENHPDFQKLRDKYFLFITTKFFVVFFNNQPLFAFENKNYTQEDIVKFIEFTHKIVIYKTIMINEKELELLKLNTQKYKKLPFQKVNNSYEFYYYLFYLLIVILFSFYIYSENLSQSNTPKIIKTEIKESYKSKEITLKIVSFIKNLTTHHIKVEKLKYDKKLHSTIIATNQNLYNFLAHYKKSHKIIKLEKLNENLFMAEIQIEL